MSPLTSRLVPSLRDLRNPRYRVSVCVKHIFQVPYRMHEHRGTAGLPGNMGLLGRYRGLKRPSGVHANNLGVGRRGGSIAEESRRVVCFEYARDGENQKSGSASISISKGDNRVAVSQLCASVSFASIVHLPKASRAVSVSMFDVPMPAWRGLLRATSHVAKRNPPVG
jgi:hypothetical protein